MPLTKLSSSSAPVSTKRSPRTPTKAAGASTRDRIRFRLTGYPEKLGGWEKYSGNTYQGSARALHNWIAA